MENLTILHTASFSRLFNKSSCSNLTKNSQRTNLISRNFTEKPRLYEFSFLTFNAFNVFPRKYLAISRNFTTFHKITFSNLLFSRNISQNWDTLPKNARSSKQTFGRWKVGRLAFTQKFRFWVCFDQLMCCDSQILALGLSVWKHFRGQSLKKSEKYFLSSSFCLVIRRNAIFEKSSFIKNLNEASECYCPSVANSSILKANF